MTHRPSTLVIDDDGDLRSTLVAMLEREGHDVIEAAHGGHALARLAEAPPHLIILDLIMPVMNGRAFLEEKAKGDHAAIPVIVFSCSPQPALESIPGVIGIVEKLSGVEALLSVIKATASARPPESTLPPAEVSETVSPSEAQIRQFANAMPHLAFIAEPDGYLSWYNAQWFEYTGTTLSQMKGWGWQSVHDPHVLPLVMQRWRLSIASGQPFEMTVPLRGKDGEYRHFLTRVTPVREAASGRLLRWFGTNTDIEAQRRAMEERDAAIASMERALRMREEFLTSAAHELRTPLTSLQLRLQLIRSGFEEELPALTPSQQGESLDVALAQVTRLGRLVHELLDVSRMAAEGLRIERVPLDLGQVTTAVVEERCHRSAQGEQPVEIRVDGPVPIDGDRTHLEQLISNLMANAVKYGGAKPIRVSVTTERDSAVLEIADGGIGIAPEDHARIFEKFERAVSSRNCSGLGLGLYIAREIARAHGGTLSVQSALGTGSVFTVSMPLRSNCPPPPGEIRAGASSIMV